MTFKSCFLLLKKKELDYFLSLLNRFKCILQESRTVIRCIKLIYLPPFLTQWSKLSDVMFDVKVTYSGFVSAPFH